jgi:hypothetical protein
VTLNRAIRKRASSLRPCLSLAIGIASTGGPALADGGAGGARSAGPSGLDGSTNSKCGCGAGGDAPGRRGALDNARCFKSHQSSDVIILRDGQETAAARDRNA